jgi:hypothetical protein
MGQGNQPLTERQRRFVLEYGVDANGGRAAVAAGYSQAGARVTAHRLLTKTNIRSALDERQKCDVRRLSIAREDALQGFLEAIERAREQNDPNAMIAGWRAVSRLLGFDAPQLRRVELRTGGDLRASFEAMSDAELTALASGLSMSGA